MVRNQLKLQQTEVHFLKGCCFYMIDTAQSMLRPKSGILIKS